VGRTFCFISKTIKDGQRRQAAVTEFLCRILLGPERW